MHVRRLLAVAVILIAFSCTYTLDEVDYIVDIKQTEPKGTVSLDDFADQDTIFLAKPTSFQYKILGTQPQNGFESEVYYDETRIVKSENLQGSFTISDQRLTTGVHELMIGFKTPSKNGSLADRSGIEFAKVWRTWKVVVDVEPPPAFEITKSIENGFLKISWPKYGKRNFVKYQVTGSYHPYLNNKFIDITDPDQNFFIDTTYSAGYDIRISVTVQNQVTSVENSVVVNEPQDFGFVYHPEDSTVDMTWRKVEYPGAFKSFVISVKNAGMPDSDVTIITKASDTTLTANVDVLFPHTKEILFRMFDKFGVERFSKSEYIHNPSNASLTLNADAWYYNATLGKVIAYDFGQIKTLNAAMEVESAFSVGNFSMPWPGRLIYYPVANAIAQRNLVTNEVRQYTVSGVNTPTVTPRAVIGANNELVNYDAYDLTVAWDRRYIRGTVDMTTNALLSEIDVDWDPKVNNPPVVDQLSDDGRYVYLRNQGVLYSVNGATRTHIGNLQNVGGFYSFRPDNNDEIITFIRPTNIVRSSDLSIIRTLHLPESGYYLNNYDPATKHILYSKPGANKCYVVNIDTGEWKMIGADGDSCILMNGFLISRGGYYIKVL
jgi:hypothetical protein